MGVAHALKFVRQAIAHGGGRLQKNHPLNVAQDFKGPDQ
jgi:hypothetical protein